MYFTVCNFFSRAIVFFSSGQPFSDYYGGKTVKGAIGSSINFTWTILRPFTRVEWGLAVTPYAFETPPRLLVSYFKGNPLPVTPPAAYTGRVSGKNTGSHVSFILSNVRKSDERLYGCKISDTSNRDDIPSFDSVTLVVEGRCNYFVVISCHRIQCYYYSAIIILQSTLKNEHRYAQFYFIK